MRRASDGSTRIEQRLREIRGRDLGSTAGAQVANASLQIGVMREHPDETRWSGAEALAALVRRGAETQVPSALPAVLASYRPGGLRSGRFVAVLPAAHGRYLVRDPGLGDDREVSRAALEDEGSGEVHMKFEARELPDWMEYVPTTELRDGHVYFSVYFLGSVVVTRS